MATHRPEPSSLTPATIRNSPEFVSWLFAAEISASLNHRDGSRPRHRQRSYSPTDPYSPHAARRRSEDMRRFVLLRGACSRIVCRGVPPGTRRPPGATGVLRYPQGYRPGSKGLKVVGADVPVDYEGVKAVKGPCRRYLPQTTRMGREVWTVDGGVRGGIRVDDDGVLEEDEEDRRYGADAQRTKEKEAVDDDGERDGGEMPYSGHEAREDFHGLKRDYDGYVSDDSDSDSDSDSDDSDSDCSDFNAESEADDGSKARKTLHQDAGEGEETTDPFDGFDGDYTGDGDDGGYSSEVTVEGENGKENGEGNVDGLDMKGFWEMANVYHLRPENTTQNRRRA